MCNHARHGHVSSSRSFTIVEVLETAESGTLPKDEAATFTEDDLA
jgi:hypothetical protein